jgi:hypothetical protein
MGRLPPVTSFFNDNYFLMRVLWQRQKLDLILWDVAGEKYDHMRENGLIQLLLECKSIMVAILCERMMQEPMRNVYGPFEEDELLCRVFKEILRSKNKLKKVLVLLIGVDLYGNRPVNADRKALADFERKYRIFPGFLKNAGISIEALPLSNIGFGNRIESEQCLRLLKPPMPYNVLEPLRRAFPLYLSWWRRKLPHYTQEEINSELNAGFMPTLEEHQRVYTGSVFISYRRESGSDTARLVRAELNARGWRTFLDVEDLRSSLFDQRLWLEIDSADNFVVILSPQCLDSCSNKKDWFRREIAYAISAGKNIVPVLKSGFMVAPERKLPRDIRSLPKYNAVEYSHSYFRAVIDKLVSFLTKEGEPIDSNPDGKNSKRGQQSQENPFLEASE